MSSTSRLYSNFTHLRRHDEQLPKLEILTEWHFAEHSNTCMLKLSQLSELQDPNGESTSALVERLKCAELDNPVTKIRKKQTAKA